MNAKILIVDDDPLILAALKELFSDIYDVILAATGAEAIEFTQNQRDIAAIILDIRMSKMNGIEAASRIKKSGCSAPIIFFTGFPGDYSREQVTREQQPFDFLTKNESPERLLQAVAEAVESWRLEADRDYLQKHALKHFQMVGSSDSMLKVFRQVEQIARSNNKVMVFGETGTGKSMVAEAIHRRSDRAGGEFRVHSCRRHDNDMVESDLFGHVKGAFTGAVADRKGLFEIANNGTVFLDEVADLDLSTQNRLLYVLETGRILPLGAEAYRKVDVRVICATNANLEQAVADRRFREDLYFRLKGATITMPALRQRRQDILPLVDYFTQKYCDELHIGLKYFERSARDMFVGYDWPGNVRWLMTCISALIDSTPSYLISRSEVERQLDLSDPLPSQNGCFKEQVKDFKRILICRGLDRHGYNVAKLARELKMDPANLRKLIGHLDINLG